MDKATEERLQASVKENLEKEKVFEVARRTEREAARAAEARTRGAVAHWPDFLKAVSAAATAVNNVIADELVYLMEVDDAGYRGDKLLVEAHLSLDHKPLVGVRLSIECDEDGIAMVVAHTGYRAQSMGTLDIFEAKQPRLEAFLAEFFVLFVEDRQD